VHAARKQDRRLAAALLAAALAHAPEAEEVLRGARTRMARKPPALARELLRNFPKRRGRGKRRRRRGGEGVGAEGGGFEPALNGSGPHLDTAPQPASAQPDAGAASADGERARPAAPTGTRSRTRRSRARPIEDDGAAAHGDAVASPGENA
jgi:hypothetical protein